MAFDKKAWAARDRTNNRERYRQYSREGKRREMERKYPPTRPCPEGCEICGGLDTNKRLALDHDNVVKKFRGWLCQNCNNGLGRFSHNPRLLEKAACYLEKSNA